MRLALALAVAVVGCCAARQPGGRVDLWPMPASVSRGARTLYVARDLTLSRAGSGYKDGKAILADAFRRMVAVIQLDHAINGSYHGLPVLAGVNVAVRSPDDKVLMCYLLTACTIPLDVFLILYMLCVLMCCTFRADKSYKLTTSNREPDICLD